MRAQCSITTMAFAGLVAIGCAKTAPDTSKAVDSASHATMTAAQHSAMHDTATPSLNDSSFAELQKRGAVVMGVDQYKSAHKFDTTPDGGRIELQRSGNDSFDVQQIRSHMRDIQKAFIAGDFAKPFAVHDRELPGTAVMTKKRDAIRYVYADLPRGAELRLVTTDVEARAAIAEFLKAQRGEHRSPGTEGH